MSVKRTACTLTGAEADAAACLSHGRCFSLLPPHLPSLPLEWRTPSSLPPGGAAVLNDTPVACQIREPTRRETGGAAKLTDEGSLVRRPAAASGAISRPVASALFVSAGDGFAPRRELLLSAVTKVAKSTGRNCVSALPQRATVGCDFPHLLAGITFHHRCQSKGLRVRSPARRLTRPLASATAGVFAPTAIPSKPSPLMGRGVE